MLSVEARVSGLLAQNVLYVKEEGRYKCIHPQWYVLFAKEQEKRFEDQPFPALYVKGKVWYQFRNLLKFVPPVEEGEDR